MTINNIIKKYSCYFPYSIRLKLEKEFKEDLEGFLNYNTEGTCEEDEDNDTNCPECGGELVELYSGIKCNSCSFTDCF